MISLYYCYIEIAVGLNFGIKQTCAAMCVLCIISVRLCEAKTIAVTKRSERNAERIKAPSPNAWGRSITRVLRMQKCQTKNLNRTIWGSVLGCFWRDSSKLKRIIYDKLIFIYVVDIPALSQSILLYALLYLIEFRYFPHRRLNAS